MRRPYIVQYSNIGRSMLRPYTKWGMQWAHAMRPYTRINRIGAG